jgi:hypothetical protein
MEYRHTQQAFLPVTLWIAFVVFLGILIPTKDWAPWIGVFVFAITIVMLVFSRLTVTVTNQTITTAFGFGWPKHTEQVSDVLTASEVRNSWLHGWGIRKISGGWMYNTSGYDAIEIDLRSGKKFRLGTDEPKALVATISMVLPASEPKN